MAVMLRPERDGASRAGRWEAPSENARCTQACTDSVGAVTQRGKIVPGELVVLQAVLRDPARVSTFGR